MRYKHSSTVTGTDLIFSVSHIHQPFICQVSKNRIVWNFRHWVKKKPTKNQTNKQNPNKTQKQTNKKPDSDYSGFITVHKARFICSKSSGSMLSKRLACSSQGRLEWIVRHPRVDVYWSCLLKLI